MTINCLDRLLARDYWKRNAKREAPASTEANVNLEREARKKEVREAKEGRGERRVKEESTENEGNTGTERKEGKESASTEAGVVRKERARPAVLASVLRLSLVPSVA